MTHMFLDPGFCPWFGLGLPTADLPRGLCGERLLLLALRACRPQCQMTALWRHHRENPLSIYVLLSTQLLIRLSHFNSCSVTTSQDGLLRGV